MAALLEYFDFYSISEMLGGKRKGGGGTCPCAPPGSTPVMLHVEYRRVYIMLE